MFESLSVEALAAVFAAAALVIAVGGIFMTGQADRLGDATGLGEAVVGGLLLGLATSLPGVVVSITAALEGRPSLAFSNGIGGIAAQTVFLVLGDMLYRRANLEHSSAEATSLFQAAMLMFMLGLPVAAYAAPEVTILGVHPVSLLLFAAYGLLVRMLPTVRRQPMWHPVETEETRADEVATGHEDRAAILPLLVRFAILGLVVGVAGWTIAKAGGRMADLFDLSDTIVGALMTAVITSLPELVTTLAAIRRGALQLAVAGIIGGNCFDVLFLSLSDIAYRPGSIYHAIGTGDLFWLVIGQLMCAILLLGLIFRERKGPGNIGLESVSIIALYAIAIAVQVNAG